MVTEGEQSAWREGRLGDAPWKGAAGRMGSAGSGGDSMAEGLWSEPVGCSGAISTLAAGVTGTCRQWQVITLMGQTRL